ncbi:MAG: tRNA lysidine(34) synthetase TilS [Chloroflexota bacterium]|nr:tRNA lysidine(34) synthetase TilS [Chloroflexota bacterium]
MRDRRSGLSTPRNRLSGFEQRALRRLGHLDLAPDSSLVLGFSGGPDSLALAALLSRIGPRAGVRVVAVHVDHQIRRDSQQEQQRAGELAAKLGVPFRATRVAGPPLDRHPGAGLEEAARRERFQVLASVAWEEGAAAVCLAHHEQDQAETVLLHLLRGAGVSGAAGMAEWSTLPVPWWSDVGADRCQPLTLWRPLLSETKDAVRRYALATGLDPIEDPSNANDELLRNAVRLHGILVLEGLRPGAVAALARFAQLAAEDDAVLVGITGEVLAKIRDSEGRLEVVALLQEQKAIQRRVVHRWLTEMGVRSGPSLERVDAVLELVGRGTGDRFLEIGEGRVVTVAQGCLLVGERTALVEKAARAFQAPLFPAEGVEGSMIQIPGQLLIGGYQVALERHGTGKDEERDAADYSASVVVPRWQVELRPPRPGDRWACSGRKLGDWLTAGKVLTLIRRRLVCVATGGAVHLVVGVPLPAFEEDAAGAGDPVRITATRMEGA